MQNFNGIKVRYMPCTNYRPSRWQFSWQGWPSDGPDSVVRRYTHFDYEHSHNKEWLANEGARLFVEWLNTDRPELNNNRAVDSVVFVHSSDPKFDVIGVTTKEAAQ